MKRSKLLLNLLMVVLIFGPVTIKFVWSGVADYASMLEFIRWMRLHQYAPEIIETYQCNYRSPCLQPIMQDYFKLRSGKIWQRTGMSDAYGKFKDAGPFQVYFIELIPSGSDTKFSLVEKEALEGFREYFFLRFGKDIEIVHRRIEINYTKELIADLADRSVYSRTGPQLGQLMKEFPHPCLVRFDAEEVGGLKVPQLWDVEYCGMFSGKDFRLANNVDSFDHYAHELAHLLGFEHQFVDPDNHPVSASSQCDVKKEKGRYLGVDDIMVKVKPAENRSAGHYLSPLSRFALEPRGGYVDNSEFGSAYNALYDRGMLERIRNQACKQ